jgi:hypothetical protein
LLVARVGPAQCSITQVRSTKTLGAGTCLQWAPCFKVSASPFSRTFFFPLASIPGRGCVCKGRGTHDDGRRPQSFHVPRTSGLHLPCSLSLANPFEDFLAAVLPKRVAVVLVGSPMISVPLCGHWINNACAQSEELSRRMTFCTSGNTLYPIAGPVSQRPK